MKLIIHIDGGSKGNPGPAAAGVIIRAADDGTVLQSVGVYIGEATNNVAEYNGLLEGLRRAAVFEAEEVEFYSDSELMVRQMNGEYRVRNENLRPLFEEACELAGGFARFSISHVCRNENTEADKMAGRAINLKRTIEE